MSRSARWVVWILIGLLVLAALLALAFFASNRMYGVWGFGQRFPGRGFYGMPMHRFAPFGMMRGFFPLRAMFIGLMCLGIPLLILIGVVGLVVGLVRGNQPRVDTTQVTTAPVVTTPVVAAPVVAADEAARAEAVSRTCPNCGRAVNEDWEHCPYCGAELTQAE